MDEVKAIAESNQQAIKNLTDGASSEIHDLHQEIHELEEDISDIVHTINVNNGKLTAMFRLSWSSSSVTY